MKTICIHIDGGKRFNECARVAADLAAQFESRLVGVHTQRPVVVPAAIAGDLARTVIGQTERADRKTLEAARQVLADLTAQRGLEAAVIVEAQGDPVAAMMPHALLADLLVVGQPAGDEDIAGVPHDYPDQMAEAAGVPVLVVPYAGEFAVLGRRILIAWKPSPQAARALRAAAPLLRKAERVDLIGFVGPRARGGSTVSAPGVAQVAAMLSAHGVAATAVERPRGDGDVGELLLSHAADVQSDLLVMGCYSHSRLRERVLGGVTRTMLGSMTLPVLMSR